MAAEVGSSEERLRNVLENIAKNHGDFDADRLSGMAAEALSASETTDLKRLVNFLYMAWLEEDHDSVQYGIATALQVIVDRFGVRLALTDDILGHIANEFGAGKAR